MQDKINTIKISTIFKNLDSRCTPILAPAGFRGHATLRILCSHKEVWWDSSKMNSDHIPNRDSITYPENGIFRDFRIKAPQKIDYIAVHTKMITNVIISFTECFDILSDYYSDNKNNLHSFVIFQMDFLDYIPNIPFIHLYSSNVKHTVKQREYWFKDDIREHTGHYTVERIKKMGLPSSNPLAFNIDVYKLYSEDDSAFETEYQKIVNHFNFTSNIDRVRSFMLTYLEREQSVLTF